jgi:hypothetical protein
MEEETEKNSGETKKKRMADSLSTKKGSECDSKADKRVHSWLPIRINEIPNNHLIDACHNKSVSQLLKLVTSFTTRSWKTNAGER